MHLWRGFNHSAWIKPRVLKLAWAMGRKCLDTYTCRIDWFGKTRKVEIVASTGSFPLIGVGLLEDHELNIHYPNRTVQLG